MGGEIYIARVARNAESIWQWDEIARDEWEVIRTSLAVVRPSSSWIATRNPSTGAEVRVPPDPDGADVFDPHSGSWVPLLSWNDGSLVFYPPRDPDFQTSQLMDHVRSIADALKATIIDGRTGGVVHDGRAHSDR